MFFFTVGLGTPSSMPGSLSVRCVWSLVTPFVVEASQEFRNPPIDLMPWYGYRCNRLVTRLKESIFPRNTQPCYGLVLTRRLRLSIRRNLAPVQELSG